MDIWEFLDKNFISIITLISTIGGAVVGGLITYFSQKNIALREIEWDKAKELKANKIEALEVYSGILELNGVTTVIEHNNGHKLEIDLSVYEHKIRPFLYKKLYYLDKDVAQLVKEIDNDIERYNFNEEAEDWEIEATAMKYLDLISKMESHLDNFRGNPILN